MVTNELLNFIVLTHYSIYFTYLPHEGFLDTQFSYVTVGIIRVIREFHEFENKESNQSKSAADVE